MRNIWRDHSGSIASSDVQLPPPVDFTLSESDIRFERAGRNRGIGGALEEDTRACLRSDGGELRGPATSPIARPPE